MKSTHSNTALTLAIIAGVSALAMSVSLAFALTDTTPPTVPTGLAVSPISTSQINLSWTASTDDVGVTGYGVFRNGSEIATTSATSYSDTGLTAATLYSYGLNAFDAAGNLSTQSTSVSTTTLSGDTTAPSVPTGLVATAVSASQINLSWTASTDNVAVSGYNVYRDGVKVGTTAATSFSDTGLSASTNHVYTIAAYDAANNVSAQSSSSSATTFASSSDTSAPSVPSGLTASAASASQINLSWSASTDTVGVTGYNVYRNGVQVGTTGSTSFSDTGLAASTGYSYTVAAYDAAGNVSSQSGSASATTLTSGTTTPTTHIQPPTVDITANGGITVHGMTVTSVGTNTFTGTVWGITYTVNYSTVTGNNGRFQFLLRNGNSVDLNASQIVVGDEVGVQGTVSSGAPLVIQAQTVRDYSITTARVPNGNGATTTNGMSISSLQALLQQLLQQYKTLLSSHRGR